MNLPGNRPTPAHKTRQRAILALAAIMLLATVGLGILTDGFAILSPVPAPPLWGPYLSGTGTDTTTISVKTGTDSTVTIAFAPENSFRAGADSNMSVTDPIPGLLHHVPLTGLEPGTTYRYQVFCNGRAGPIYSFTTFPAGGRFTFAVYGDTQDELPNFSQEERHQLVAERIAADREVLFVVNTGDLVNDGNDPANWDRYFAAARSMGTRLPVFPARGNHDGDTIFPQLFGVSPYYSFDCGGAHFTILDSMGDSAAQAGWLAEDLAADRQWKFVFFHHPMYTSQPNHFGGWENLKDEWEPIFKEHRVDAVWNGHVHVYERYLADGIMYMVAGTGGGPYSILESVKYPGYQNSLERSLGYSRVTVDPDHGSAVVEYIQVARISVDGKQVSLLPPGTVFENFSL